MPFGQITLTSGTYDPRSAGHYMESSVGLGDPTNEIRINPGRRTQNGDITFSVTRVIEKDVTVGDDVFRRQLIVPINCTVPSQTGFTSTDVDSAVEDISELLTSDTITRILQGEA